MIDAILGFVVVAIAAVFAVGSTVLVFERDARRRGVR